MNVTEAILQRRSVRTYTGKALDAETIRKITEYAAGSTPPFGVKCRIGLIRADMGAKPVRLGTYGAVKGASNFLALIMGDDELLAEEGAAYMFEQVVLYCTSLGLGTCWLAGFNRRNFSKRLTLRHGEKVRIVSPVGYPSDKRHLSLLSVLGASKPTPRKPFSANFFHDRFGDPLTEEAAGIYAPPLEMVRLAPSANNRQSWRVVMDGEALHFYKSASSGFGDIDLGIALCHFEQTCLELGIAGRYEVLGDAPEGKKAAYVISWVVRP